MVSLASATARGRALRARLVAFLQSHALGFWGIALALAALSSNITRGLANDVWWDWIVGFWEVVHREPMSVNLLTYHDGGRLWINTEYAWGPIVWMFAHGGYAGLVAMAGIGIAGWFVALDRLARSLGAHMAARAGILAVGFAATLGWWDFRPQVWAYWAAAGVLAWLWAIRRGLDQEGAGAWIRARGWQLLPFGAAVIAWSAIHGSWILVLGWLAIEILTAGRWGHRAFFAGLGAGLLALVSWVNPWGPVFVLHSLLTASNAAIANNIGEWFSPDFHVFWWLGLFLAYALGGAFLLTRARAPWRSWLYFAGFAAGALYAERFLPYLALGACVPLSAWGLPEMLRDRLAAKILWRRLAGPVGIAGLLFSAAFMIAGASSLPRGGIFGPVSRRFEPVGATTYLLAHGDRRVFSMVSWGGYLEARGLRPWIDGRADFWLSVGRAFQDYGRARMGDAPPAALVARSGARVALVKRGEPFAWGLRAAGWRVVYRGRADLILVPPTGTGAGR